MIESAEPCACPAETLCLSPSPLRSVARPVAEQSTRLSPSRRVDAAARVSPRLSELHIAKHCALLALPRRFLGLGTLQRVE